MYYTTQVVSEKGRRKVVPAIKDDDVTIVVTKKIIKIARIHDEVWLEPQCLPEPLKIIERLRSLQKPPDIFSFAQRLPDVGYRYPFYFEFENVAAATIETYRNWFEKQVDRSVRKNIKKARREGLIAKETQFNDKLVEGICSIYNELKVRQGKHFWHYGKRFDEVKQDNVSYLDRSVFIGAYLEEELVGFLKFMIVGDIAIIMQILSKAAHFPKRPMNALISKAVELCELRGLKFLIYGEHTYGKKNKSSLIKFKEKNGFKKIEFPRYYIPLTAKGQLALKIGTHKGLINLLPSGVTKTLVSMRSKYYEWRVKTSEGS